MSTDDDEASTNNTDSESDFDEKIFNDHTDSKEVYWD